METEVEEAEWQPAKLITVMLPANAKLLTFGDDLNVFVETTTREDTQRPQNA